MLTGQEIDVTSYFWVNNDRILYTINQGEATYDSAHNGGSIFGVDIDGSNHGAIVKSLFERWKTPGEKHRGFIRVSHTLPDDPKYVLVEDNSRRDGYPELYKMNVNNGSLKKVSGNPGYIVGYFYDAKGEVLGGVWWENQDDPSTASIYWRDIEKNTWTMVMDIESIYDIPSFLGFSEKGKKVVVSKRASNGFKHLYTISFDGKKYSEELLFADDEYDLDSITSLVDFKTLDMVGIRYEQDKPVNVFFDDTHAALYRMINDAIPDGSNYVYDFDDSGTKLLVLSTSDQKSPEYYLLDLKQGAMEPLGQMFPDLENLYLPEQKPIQFEARDGYVIHGYLYLPEGFTPGTPVPMIVNPHGGPWARDKWGIRWWYDKEPIFLTSRGFAVLKVNFRASTGYGKKHETASYKNFDVTMEDIWDGVSWAIEEGYADKDRIGVMGASFGGTATMLSLVHQADMFQFGVNFFGVVDLPEQIKTYYEWDRDIAGDSWKIRVGDPKNKEDRANLYRWSAINYIENIDDPLFLYHGLVDTLVDIEQTRALEGKLKKFKKDFVISYDTDEGHGAYNAEKRIELYKKLDEFLKPFAPAYGN